MLDAVKAGREELEQLFAKDRERFEREHGGRRGLAMTNGEERTWR